MNPLDKMHSSWNKVKESLLNGTFTELEYLNKEILSKQKYYPKQEDIFNVFTMPMEDIKVVILGQDPYPKEGQAIGYAFAVSEETSMPASLRIIQKEVGHDINKTLEHWRNQGVFLLNTALTVQEGKASSHIKYWDNFTKTLLRYISTNNENIIWVLWGKYAQNFKPYINSNNILEAPHPASEAYKPGSGFIGCNHFKLINSILEQQNKQQIKF